MRKALQFYIGGQWLDPVKPRSQAVVDPATEQPMGEVSLGSSQDVDRAVAAAVAAFPDFSQTSREERLDLLARIVACFAARHDDIAKAIMEEMGAPWKLAKDEQAASGPQHFSATIDALNDFQFEEALGSTRVLKEPIGACALITPWNWPINQIAVKVAPALAAGCTMVLKPSEIAPFDAVIFAEVLHAAGVPPGVFNLINGDGAEVGAALAGHPDIAMVSFTGSTRAGADVARRAAQSVKRVAQELGGKSANIILEDADFGAAVQQGVRDCFDNSGQSCNAPTRMLVPGSRLKEAEALAREIAEKIRVGEPRDVATQLGPVASEKQWRNIQSLIQAGIDEGATLIAGGVGRPAGISKGYYVKPTVFSRVSTDMTIAEQEIFGPVLAIMGYDDEDEAVTIANKTPYGLSGYVHSENLEHARAIARLLRTGMVHINGAPLDSRAPFGGYKQSGNGREWGAAGIEEFLERKSVYGYAGR